MGGGASRVVRAPQGSSHRLELPQRPGRGPAACQLVFHRLYCVVSAVPGNYFTSIISPKFLLLRRTRMWGVRMNRCD